jgi:hypothetical protein
MLSKTRLSCFGCSQHGTPRASDEQSKESVDLSNVAVLSRSFFGARAADRFTGDVVAPSHRLTPPGVYFCLVEQCSVSSIASKSTMGVHATIDVLLAVNGEEEALRSFLVTTF